jgi:hypothetical protein
MKTNGEVVLVGSEWSASRHDRSAPGERAPFPVPTGQDVGWAPGPVWTIRRTENFLPHRDSNTDPSVASELQRLLL